MNRPGGNSAAKNNQPQSTGKNKPQGNNKNDPKIKETLNQPPARPKVPNEELESYVKDLKRNNEDGITNSRNNDIMDQNIEILRSQKDILNRLEEVASRISKTTLFEEAANSSLREGDSDLRNENKKLKEQLASAKQVRII